MLNGSLLWGAQKAFEWWWWWGLVMFARVAVGKHGWMEGLISYMVHDSADFQKEKTNKLISSNKFTQ